MAILPIRIYPDPVLREPAQLVPIVDDAVRKLVVDMGETMRAAPGVGLAAPQVGVQRRVLVYSASESDDITGLINPEILERSDETVTDDEGCLSIPGLAYPVPRAQRVRVRALDVNGNLIEIDAIDMEARILQHEIDHLDGVLFLERIDPALKREALGILRERGPQPSSWTPTAPSEPSRL
jgi:peptide deformylase